MDSDYLFVYGTLQEELDNDMSKFLVKHSENIGKGYIHAKLYKISWYPGAVLSHSKTNKVYGTVFKLKQSKTVFKVLDEYEGYVESSLSKSLYVRKRAAIYLQNNTQLKAWVYEYNQSVSNENHISSGDFLKDAR